MNALQPGHLATRAPVSTPMEVTNANASLDTRAKTVTSPLTSVKAAPASTERRASIWPVIFNVFACPRGPAKGAKPRNPIRLHVRSTSASTVEFATKLPPGTNSVIVLRDSEAVRVTSRRRVPASEINAKILVNVGPPMITSKLLHLDGLSLLLTKLNLFSSYSCECRNGFSGQFCEKKFQGCQENPCLVGECMESEHGFQCKCPPGYRGDNCEV